MSEEYRAKPKTKLEEMIEDTRIYIKENELDETISLRWHEEALTQFDQHWQDIVWELEERVSQLEGEKQDIVIAKDKEIESLRELDELIADQRLSKAKLDLKEVLHLLREIQGYATHFSWHECADYVCKQIEELEGR